MTAPASIAQPPERGEPRRARLAVRDRAAVRIDGRYSRFVGMMKMLLPAVALALTAAVFAWPSEFEEAGRLEIAFVEAKGKEADRLTMLNPRYLGTDAEQRPFVVTAKIAEQDPKDQRRVSLSEVQADMSDGNVHTMVVTHDGSTIEVFVDDLINPLISVPWDFATGGTYIGGAPVGGLNLINGDSAYLGFTAGTGGAAENHDVLNWFWTSMGGPIGTPYCGPANTNSSNQSGVISAFGQTSVVANDVRLDAVQMAANQFGMFLNSLTPGFVVPPGSQGNLCLGGGIGRYKDDIMNSGSAGEMSLQLDLNNTPTPGGIVAIQPGETWHFQAWFRDSNPNQTSNFTDGVLITFL